MSRKWGKIIAVLALFVSIISITVEIISVRRLHPIISEEETEATTAVHFDSGVIKKREKLSYIPEISEDMILADCADDRHVWVGDSRYVGMSLKSQTAQDTYVSKEGEGIGWLYANYDSLLAKYGDDEEVVLIIGLGVNDLVKSDEYIKTLNEMTVDFKCKICYMSVNPVDEERESYYGYGTTNASIDAFNKKLKDGLLNKIHYIDTNSYLKQKGITTIDGLHYDDSTYKMIYRYIKCILGTESE